MGLCFFLEEHGGRPFVAHSGSQNGFISHFYVNVESRTAYVVAFNTVAEPVGPDGKAERPPGRSGRPRLPREERHSRLNGTVGMSGGWAPGLGGAGAASPFLP